MPLVDRGTHRVHYEVLGRDDAPPLLLVMGMGFSSRAWHTLPSALRRSFRVVQFDNCGTGRSTVPRGVYRTRDMADDAAAVLDHAGVATAFVFGISMGGMIAQELALRHPERVRALALGATFAGHLRSRKPSLRTGWDLLRTVTGGRRGADAARLARLARLLVSAEHFAAQRDAFVAWLRSIEHATPRVAFRQMTAVALHDTTRRLSRLRVPTLVITGDRDRLVPPANSYRLARLIPGARLVVLPGAGHVFPVERPRETVAALEEFFLGGGAEVAAEAAAPAPDAHAGAK
jgi:3-oxoadipate enol-lactonase